MPVYDYKCSNHGLFHELATMADSGKPAACPQCQGLSPRVIMIPPEVLDMAPARRQAMSRNERSKHEPQVSTTETREQQAIVDQYGRPCGCKGKHKHPENSSLTQQVVYMADGSKVFPSQRPWMISH